MILLNDIIADMLGNKKRQLIVTELFIRSRKLKVSPVFIGQPYFVALQNVTLNFNTTL